MNQTRLGSLIEAVISTAIGFAVTMMAAPIIYPLFGHRFTMAQNIGITAVFTVISVLRQFVVRRWFNARIHAAAQRLAAAAS